jgi:hypothetical protein
MNVKSHCLALVFLLGMIDSGYVRADFSWLSTSEPVPLLYQWPMYSFQGENIAMAIAVQSEGWVGNRIYSKTAVNGVWDESILMGGGGPTVLVTTPLGPAFVLSEGANCGNNGCLSFLITVRYFNDGAWTQPTTVATGEGNIAGLAASYNEKYGVLIAWAKDGRIYTASINKDGVLSVPVKTNLIGSTSYTNNLSLTSDSQNKSFLLWSARSSLDYTYSIQSSAFSNGSWGQAQIVRDSLMGDPTMAAASTYPSGALAIWNNGRSIETSATISGVWEPHSQLEVMLPSGYLRRIDLFPETRTGYVTAIVDCSEYDHSIQAISRYKNQWSELLDLDVYSSTYNVTQDSNGYLMLAWISGDHIYSRRHINGIWAPPAQVPNTHSASALRVDSNLDGTVSLLFAKQYGAMYDGLYIKSSSNDAKRINTRIIGNGGIISDPNGISCNPDCEGYFQENSIIELLPSVDPATGWKFSSWSGSCYGQSTCRLTMNEDKDVSGVFVVSPQYLLRVVKSNKGIVQSQPIGIYCGKLGNMCNHRFYEGQNIKLSAMPESDYLFSGWSGCDEVLQADCFVNISKKVATVKAVYSPKPKYKLAITKTKNGSVLSDVGKLNCGKNKVKCGAQFTDGTQITLTLRPAIGHTFIGWSGACEGAATDTCTITMDGHKTVGAAFK